ncbi:phage recombination protein Bet [Ramlibacter sp.]|uniref:phage recombination protein Bet n=1 Tax=Ramlibacter sp. TaxID=1917967 RepID=UPI003D0A3109
MNALAKTEQTALAAQDEREFIETLQSSLYPGAKVGSIKLVLSYCAHANLDPMDKPVHIVPMNVKDAQTGKYEWRDVIMPGINNYRSKAARTGQLVGISEPEFGPMVSANLSGVDITYPEWARVTVRRLLPSGMVAEFPAKEYWIENYATAGKDTSAPNTMWRKRIMGQIGKCAEAQALRKAFPEIGAAPTAEEMEGKSLTVDDGRTIDVPVIKHMGSSEAQPEAAAPAEQQSAADSRPEFPAADFEKGLPVWRKAAARLPVGEVLTRAEAANPDFAFTEKQKATILSLKKAADGPTFASVADALVKAQDMDALNLAGDLIGGITDPEQKRELQAKYDEREQALTVEG